ncbi:MFS transporter [Nocardioides sp. KC13]|uniref:MFS transporter n=1 Tax=Nocardioides turkmenicus TaxID=2711220 RepID=A0A6M1QVE8_9ACTN|nr:MFS transporter [Nocardioides sp. KC13]NGN91786.1 MFS transporter [Nocardioides sp. KC13]
MSRTLSPKAAFAGLAAIFAAFFFAAGAPTPLLSLRQQEWGFSAGTLTFAFSVYALGLLVALLVGGSLSDHLGRRPVLIAALGGELVSMAVFLVASDIGWVIVARALQGLATGLATSAFSAAIVEHAPDHLKKLAGGLAAASVAGGLALGALATGAAVQFTPAANTLVFGALALVMVLGIVFVVFTSETSSPRAGAWRSLAPRISVPGNIRAEFLAGIPVHVAAWMTPAFFLGLSPAVLRLHFDLDGGLVTGFTAFLGPFVAALASFWFARHPARRSTITGKVLVLVGMVVVVAGVLTTTLPVLWLGAVVGGLGFGAAFGGQLRLVVPHIQPQERAGVFAGIYTVAYLSFGVPVIIAGQLAPRWGLIPTFELYAGVLIGVAALGIVIQAGLGRRESTRPATAGP